MVTKKDIERVRKHKELTGQLEELDLCRLHIKNGYDVKLFDPFGQFKSVKLPDSKELSEFIFDYIEKQISDVKKQLEEL